MQGALVRSAVVILGGPGLWLLLTVGLPLLPASARFVVTLGLLTFGSGAAIGIWFLRAKGRVEQAVVLSAFGVAAAPVAADVLSRLHALPILPYVAAAGAMLPLAVRRTTTDAGLETEARADGVGILLVCAIALLTCVFTFGHRLKEDAQGTTVYGDYDSVDLSYYAAVTAELTHTNPPQAPFYAGHPLNYSYYPQLLLATVHRVGDVPILEIYFRWAWPAFLVMTAAMALVFARCLLPLGAARLAVILLLVGGDFSYAFVWWFRPDTYLFDWLLWPTNFLAPTMEVLHFSTWTPALVALFAGLYALHHGISAARGKIPFLLLAGFCFGTLVESKPFAFLMLMAGLGMTAFVRTVTRRGAADIWIAFAASAVCAAPFVYQILSLYAESRGHFVIDYFLLPRIMLDKLAIADAFERTAARVAGTGFAQQAVILAAATLLFFVGGLGMRWLGTVGVARSLSGRPDLAPAWQVLAWTVVAGIVVPFVIVTEPYGDSLQFYQTSLFLLWIFAAGAVWRAVDSAPSRRLVAAAVVVLLALPSSIHYLREKSGDGPKHPLFTLSRAELTVADYLNKLPIAETVVLHDRPQDPSGLLIASERRVVLAWSRYVTGSESRRDDVDAFFGSADSTPEAAFAILDRYRVTHVVNRPDRDRIHPAVLARLTPLVRTPGVTLYAYDPGRREGR